MNADLPPPVAEIRPLEAQRPSPKLVQFIDGVLREAAGLPRRRVTAPRPTVRDRDPHHDP